MEAGLSLPKASPTAALLRPDQVEEMEGERESLKKILNDREARVDRGAVMDQLRRVDHQLETQRPRPFAAEELDRAVKREAELRTQWLEGMPSQEEMRKCPPGAVDKHRAWEKRNKVAIAEWQNIQRRLNAGNDDRESASIERFRPVSSSLNMQNALIPGKQFFLPPEGVAPGVTFSNAELQILRETNPALADTIGLLNNEQRASVKEMLINNGVFDAAHGSKVPCEKPHYPAKKKKKMNAADKAAFAEKMRLAREAKKAT